MIVTAALTGGVLSTNRRRKSGEEWIACVLSCFGFGIPRACLTCLYEI
jgi:hypothetical protein